MPPGKQVPMPSPDYRAAPERARHFDRLSPEERQQLRRDIDQGKNMAALDDLRDKVEQVFNTLSYFDGMNLAARARAKALFSAGLMDMICPPSTVYAAFHHWGAQDKQILTYQYNGHEGGGGFHTQEKIKFLQTLWG